jgi:hypothetical protein
MSEPLLFPSRAWVEAAVRELQKDPTVQAALADFGPVVAGIVIQKGPGLDEDLCVLARLAPGKPFDVSFADDEDELEDQEPDYLGWAPYKLVRELLESAMGGALGILEELGHRLHAQLGCTLFHGLGHLVLLSGIGSESGGACRGPRPGACRRASRGARGRPSA